MYKQSIEISGQTLTIETGRMAKQASGSVLVTYGETVVLGGDRVVLSDLDPVDTLIGFSVLGLPLKRPVFFVSAIIGLRIKPFFKK